MLDKSFVSPNYCVKHIEASCVYDFSLEHPSSGSVKATEEEIEEIMELFNSIYGMNKLEVIYELYHMKWDSRSPYSRLKTLFKYFYRYQEQYQ